MLMPPRTMRKRAEIVEPIMPPTVPKEPKRSLMAAAVEATTRQVMITMLGVLVVERGSGRLE